MIRAYIFDLDDTLMPEEAFIESGFRHVAGWLGERYGRADFYPLLMELYEENPAYVFNRLLDRLGIAYTKSTVSELVRQFRQHTPDVSFYEDVVPFLQELKESGMKTGIITDGYAVSQRNKLTVLGAEELVDVVVVTYELGREFWKPHPRAFELMRSRLGVAYEEMVYIGDNVQKDFVTPNRLGMQTVRIFRPKGVYHEKNFGYPSEYYASMSIHSLFELKKWLPEAPLRVEGTR
ncbi:HAD family hydrolase [Halobacillus fulvus]|nr:HAD family hydrolase [Halobacillus fulvus]